MDVVAATWPHYKVSVLILMQIGPFLKFLHLMSYLNVELASQKSTSIEKFDCI